MSESWRAIPGYEGIYEVSDVGNVRSLARADLRGRNRKARNRTPVVTRTGHRTFALRRNGERHTSQVGRLVLMAFVGPCPDGMEACHWNDDPSDNRVANLRWDTRAANTADSVRNGTHHMTRKTHCPQGHEYTAENTYLYPPTGRRACNECRRAYRDAHREERRTKGREYMRRRRAMAKAAA